jgi:anti-sigma B factor antagonist
VRISGRIDVYSASAVGEAIQSLIADGAENIVVDVSSVTRIDSSGLGTLVGNAKSAASCGGTISLVGISDTMRKTLEITNLAGYFRIHDSVDEALDGLKACALSHTQS